MSKGRRAHWMRTEAKCPACAHHGALCSFIEKIAAPGAQCETDIPEVARALRTEGVNVRLVDKYGIEVPYAR